MTGRDDPAQFLRAALAAGIEPLLALARFRAAQDRFHADFARNRPVTCHRGCSSCCSQMVFDVTPVEAEDLGRHLRRTGRDRDLLDALKRRRDLYDEVRRVHPRGDGETDDDWTERVAMAFWSQDEPCALLSADGACSVFEHRPQSCRRFLVHGPADLCTPSGADSPERQAHMVEPGSEDEVDILLHVMSWSIPFDPEDDRLDHAMVRWLENRSRE